VDFRTRAEQRGSVVAMLVLIAVSLPREMPQRTAPPPASPPAAEAREAGDPRLDLNRAGAAELQSLPGIGPVLADRIVAHRERHGPFEAVAELRAVRGIGPKLLSRFESAVRVRPAPPPDTGAGAARRFEPGGADHPAPGR
jgi:competence ComEA-like helix-hairpin-helix protein